jgi:pimeloyl-ACP methyl ester carboxylesterase
MNQLPSDLQTLYPFTSKFFSHGDHKQHYIDEGTGPVVVMLHGNPTWSFYYRNVVLLLRRNFRCIVPDHMGCGFSDKPQTYPYTLDQHIKNLSALLEHLGVEEARLVVHDWGGAIGAGWAVENQDKFKGWVVLNTAAFRSPRIPWRINLLRCPILGEWVIRAHNGFAGPALKMAVCCEMNPNVGRGLMYPYNNYKNRVAIAGFVKDIPMTNRHPSYLRLKGIEDKLPEIADRPILLGWGMRDFCFDPGFLEEWQRRFPKARTISYPRAGHYILEDAETELIPEIGKFLEGT